MRLCTLLILGLHRMPSMAGACLHSKTFFRAKTLVHERKGRVCESLLQFCNNLLAAYIDILEEKAIRTVLHGTLCWDVLSNLEVSPKALIFKIEHRKSLVPELALDAQIGFSATLLIKANRPFWRNEILVGRFRLDLEIPMLLIHFSSCSISVLSSKPPNCLRQRVALERQHSLWSIRSKLEIWWTSLKFL